MLSEDLHEIDFLILRAKEGKREALESLVRLVQRDVHSIAMRFLWHPQDAEDATQEILIRVITGLAGFKGESSFRTWVFRIASNTLLTLGKKRMEQSALTFEEFGDALATGLSVAPPLETHDISEELLIEEVKIGCTHALLMCLDREHRFAYILGEIMDLDHREGAEILAITPVAFRKRLSRAKSRIVSFMTSHCGLIEASNACQCRLRVGAAIDHGCIQPKELLFAQSLAQTKRFPEVLQAIRQLEETRRVAALYRSHPQAEPSDTFMLWLTQLLDEMPDLNSSTGQFSTFTS
ncbi:RNA polymerase sigma factor [Methylomonas sp. 11b]|uniref:RNA polymerase sigma factor n=1 Tax=Methylomonas sp. 11b TaxID=1168169 RepID=UPI00047C0820|nr:RNA polymerase sigma factor [Methylomonas sp. 11b]